MITDTEVAARQRVERYTAAKAEAAAATAAQLAGQPAPPTPNLDALRPHVRRGERKFWSGVREQRSKVADRRAS